MKNRKECYGVSDIGSLRQATVAGKKTAQVKDFDDLMVSFKTVSHIYSDCQGTHLSVCYV